MELMGGVERVLAALGWRGPLEATMLLHALILARVVTAISMSPFLGGQSVPGRARIGLAMVIAILLSPTLALPGSISIVIFVALLAKEIVIGAIMGFFSQVVFYAVEMAGALIDTQRGMNQINVNTPQLPGNASILGMLQLQAALALFLTFDGHIYYVRAVADSFAAIPPSVMPKIAGGGLAVVELVIRVSTDLFAVALRLSAPVLLALFAIDVIFGIFNRVVSQIQINSENQTVKGLFSLWILVMILPLLAKQLRDYPIVLFRHLADFVAGFR